MLIKLIISGYGHGERASYALLMAVKNDLVFFF